MPLGYFFPECKQPQLLVGLLGPNGWDSEFLPIPHESKRLSAVSK
jgi:hypothetical protein